jgi:rhamnosyltransferase
MFHKIAAYVTAYNDIEATKKCIETIKDQSYPIEEIFIIDNSKISLNILSFQYQNITIEHYPENIGVSEGLKKGISRYLDKKYDFLWTFDQDSQPDRNALEILLSEYDYLNQQQIPVGIISPTIIESQTKQILPNDLKKAYRLQSFSPNLIPSPFPYYREKLYQCYVVITSGSLINLNAAKQTPLPNPDLFIDGVDWDYCLKLQQNGYHICVTQKAFMHHNFGTYLTNFGKEHPVYIYSPLRYYYINRNHTYIETRLSSNPLNILLSFIHRLKTLIKKIIKIIIFEPDQKPLKIWASCLGFTHGIIGKLGKTWLPPK